MLQSEEKQELLDTRALLYRKPFRRVLPSTTWIIPQTLSGPVVQDTVYLMAVEVPYRCTISHVIVKWGPAAVAGNCYVVIYRDMGNTPALGARVGISNSTAKSGTDRLQMVPLTAPVRIDPGIYWAGFLSDDASQIYYGIGSLAAADWYLRMASYMTPFGMGPSDPCPAVVFNQYPIWVALVVQSIP